MLIGANCANYKKNSISVCRIYSKPFFLKTNKLTNTKCNLKQKQIQTNTQTNKHQHPNHIVDAQTYLRVKANVQEDNQQTKQKNVKFKLTSRLKLETTQLQNNHI